METANRCSCTHTHTHTSNFIEKIEGKKAFINSEKGRLFKNKNSLSFCCF